MGKFESSEKVIPYSQERVYNKLSDLNNLEEIKDQLPKDNMEDLVFDSDSMSFKAPPPFGDFSIQVVERKPFELIKFQTVVSPIPMNLTIRIVPLGGEECEMKLILDISLNPIMRGMIARPLQDGMEKIANLLANTAY